MFTFFWEIDALCELKDYRGALRQLRRRDAMIGEFQPKRLRRTRNDPELIQILATDYAPLFYFLGRYREGCLWLEKWLATWFQQRKVSSFDFWLHVIDPDAEPVIRQRVALSHFYRKLGRDLREWRHWPQFVSGFHPRLFRLAGIAREALLADSRLLTPFCENLLRIREQRNFTGTSGGLSDLIQSAAQVRKEQLRIQRQLDASSKWIQPRIDQSEARIRELFPELLRPPE